MADPLSIAASIAGLIALSAGLLKLTNNVHSILKEEPAELVLKISKEIELLCGVLSHLQVWTQDRRSLRGVSPKGDQELADFMPFINSCTNVVKKIGDQLLVLEATAKRKGIQKLFSAVTYKEKVKQLESLRNDLEKSKTTLIISLTLRNRKVTKPLTNISDSLSNMSDLSDAILDLDKNVESVQAYRGPNSFEEWLESFAGPNDSGQLEAYRAKKRKQREKEATSTSVGRLDNPLPESGQVCIRVENLQADDGKTVTENIVLNRYAPVSKLIQRLHSKGYKRVCGFQTEDGAVRYGEVTSKRRPIFVTVTSGPSSYSRKQGLLINRHQRFVDYFNQLILDQQLREDLNIASAPAETKEQELLHGLQVLPPDPRGSKTSINFQRTLRVPDDGTVYSGAMDFGSLPLFKTSKFEGRIPESMAKKGGYFFPLMQREAVALTFDTVTWTEDSSKGHFAMKVFAGSINVVSGSPAFEESTGARDPDYIVIPEQRRLDGFQISDSTARQLVAMPSARGYSLEEQLIGTEFIRGIQLMIAAPLRGAPRFRRFETFRDISEGDAGLDLLKSPIDLGLESTQILLDFRLPSEKATSRWDIQPISSTSAQSYGELLNRVKQYGRTSSNQLPSPGLQDYIFMAKPPPNPPKSPKEYRETLVNDLFWHESGSLHSRNKESTVLRPITDLFFSFQTVIVDSNGSFATATTKEERFHAFLDLSDFLGIVCRIGFETKLAFGSQTRDSTLDINGFHVNSILEAYNPHRYTPIADIDTIAQGGTITFIFYPITRSDLRFSSGYGMTSIKSSDDARDRNRKIRLSADSLQPRSLSRYGEECLRRARGRSKDPELCLGIHGLVCQQIHKSTGISIWDWNNSTLVNIQIVNAAFFQQVTGITAVSRIPLKLSDQVTLAKTIALPQTMRTTPTAPLALETISQVDAKTKTKVGLSLDRDNTAIGCACCEVNYSDTILQPCNHVFCSDCIQVTMTDIRNRVTCDACGVRTSNTIPYAGTMELPRSREQTEGRLLTNDINAVVPTAGRRNFGSHYPPYMMDDHATTKIKEMEHKYSALLSPYIQDLTQYNFVEQIAILSYSPSLLASEIRQLRKLSLGARVILLSDILQNPKNWTPRLKSRSYESPTNVIQAENSIQNEAMRITNMVRSLVSLVPNIDDMHGDGNGTRIAKMFLPKDGLYFGNFIGGAFDIIFEWATSGSYSLLELEVSIPRLLEPLIHWGRQTSIDLVLEYLHELSGRSESMDLDLDEIKVMVPSDLNDFKLYDYCWVDSRFRVVEWF